MDVKCSVTTNQSDFPHNVLKVALTKYFEKFQNHEVDEEGLVEMRKDITKFLTRLVKTGVEVNVDAVDTDLQVSFELVHELR